MSVFTAGQKIRASDLNRACPTEFEQEATADLTLTTSFADITGATITFTTSVANAVCIINADFDLRITNVTGLGYQYGAVMIDGVQHGRTCVMVFQSAESRAQGHLRIKTTLASAGSHTIKLRGRKDGGTSLFAAVSTVLGLTVYGV